MCFESIPRWIELTLVCLLTVVFTHIPSASGAKVLTIVHSPSPSTCVLFGAQRLLTTLEKVGIPAVMTADQDVSTGQTIFLSNSTTDPFVANALASTSAVARSPEEWFIVTDEQGRERIIIGGGGDSGTMYGCLELAARIEEYGALPQGMRLIDGPRLRFRGPAHFWMKRGGYDYPVTPAEFPWFYDREFMLAYLDQLVENRLNTLYFWNGHPFVNFLRLPEYPEAQGLSDEQLDRNIEQLQWLTTEAERRGVWIIFVFYNIHVSPAFAAAHGVGVASTQSTPLLAAYIRYCVAEFVKNYANLGLMACAGEALQVNREEWIRDVIIAGIKDSGKEVPLIVREWMIDRDRFAEIVVPAYDKLYTMMKHNVEMLVSPVPDPRHRYWSGLGGHQVNVHENSDIKPLRWGSPSFIREMVEHWLNMGVAGAHIMPPSVSWQWPVCLDKVDPPLLATQRDWIWLEAFGRYCWNPYRNADQEREHWIARLQAKYGSREVAEHLLAYYESTGPVLPGIQNVISFRNMNGHPTVVGRGAKIHALLKSIRSNGLDIPLSRPLDHAALSKYVAKFGGDRDELAKLPPMSIKEYVETIDGSSPDSWPLHFLDPCKVLEILQVEAQEGFAHARRAAQLATVEQEELDRFVQDAELLQAIVEFYQTKSEAAVYRARYDRRQKPGDVERFFTLLEKSVEIYQRLTEMARKAYTQPSDLTDRHSWTTTLHVFREELAFYQEQRRIAESGTAEVLCLGVNGPFEDPGHAFHLAITDAARQRKWQLLTYLLSPRMIEKAQLLIVYNLSDRFVQSNLRQILAWVRRGGHLLVWDEQARFWPVPGLLDGLEVNGPSDERILIRSDPSYAPDWPQGTMRFKFEDLNHPLVGPLRKVTIDKSVAQIIPNSISSFDKRWHLLAHSILINKNAKYLFSDWVGGSEAKLCPLILEKSEGQGRIAIMQLGRWEAGVAVHEQFCHTLAENVMTWAGMATGSAHEGGEHLTHGSALP